MPTLNPFAIAGQLIAAILPAPVTAVLRSLVDKVEGLLQGETARAIGYGAGVVIYLVALAFDRIPDMSFDQAVINATFAVTTLVGIVEAIRHYVFSPASVAAIVANPPIAAGPINAAAAAGVDPSLIVDALDDGEGPVDESTKGAPLPEGGDEVEPEDDLPLSTELEAAQ